MESWTLSSGARRKRGIQRRSIQEYTQAGKIPQDAFIAPDDETDDWRQIATVDWLREAPEFAVPRHCLECDARSHATEDLFANLARCPNCGNVTKFVDYLSVDIDPIPNVPVEPWGKYDAMVVTDIQRMRDVLLVFRSLGGKWLPPSAN